MGKYLYLSMLWWKKFLYIRVHSILTLLLRGSQNYSPAIILNNSKKQSLDDFSSSILKLSWNHIFREIFSWIWSPEIRT